MATALTFNDFRYGMVSEYMRRRTDLALYQKSASLIENAVPMRTGGVRLRPGMIREADLTAIGAKRIIPFVISVREHYLIILCPNRIHIYGLDISGAYEDVSNDGFVTQYTASEIPEIQVAYNYDRLILVQRNHPPFVIEKGDTGGWSAGNIVLDTTTSAYNYTYDEEGNETKSALSYDYQGLFTTNNFPSVAAYHANRLWLGGSIEHPYRMWASRPFEYSNFQTIEYYNYLDESLTTDQYMDAIAGAGETREELDDGNIWIVTKTVNAASGIVVTTSVIQNEDGTLLGHREYDPETDTWGDPVYDGSSWTYSFKYTRAVQSVDTTTTEACALQLDMASDRDETISWLASNGDLIFVGTASSEWAMPSSINALNQTINKLTSYGSAAFMQSCYGVKNIFYMQSGGKLLRSIYTDGSGVAYAELTYQCPEILSAGVVKMAWQRVPEPRLYCILKDGTIAVLCYDTDYDINAWCIWKSDVLFRSVAVVDTEDGQEVFFLAERGDGSLHLVRMKDGVYTDDGNASFIAVIRTNDLDSSTTMLYTKKTYRIAADSMHTRFSARMNDKPPAVAYDYNRNLVKLWNWTEPTDNGLRAEFRSFEGEDMILLAVIAEMEVSD